jgi:hypothetical protein
MTPPTKVKQALGWHIWVWAASVALILFSTLWQAVDRWGSPSGPPVIFDRVEPLKSPIHVGDRLVVRIYREKRRDDCPVTSFRSAVDQDGRTYDLPDRSWAGGPAGTEYLDAEYDTSALPVGQYDLVVELSYACPEQTFPIDQPQARFRVHNGLGTAPLETVIEQQRVMIEDLRERVEQLAPETGQ